MCHGEFQTSGDSWLASGLHTAPPQGAYIPTLFYSGVQSRGGCCCSRVGRFFTNFCVCSILSGNTLCRKNDISVCCYFFLCDRGKDREIEENSQRNREMVKIQHIYREPICFSFTHWFSITNVASYS